MVCIGVDVFESFREVLLGIWGHYALVENECSVSNGDCYLVETSTEEASRGDILRIDISKLVRIRVSEKGPLDSALSAYHIIVIDPVTCSVRGR